jgi:UDPglucose--hexose-1-phosphate uridylyltransferase
MELPSHLERTTMVDTAGQRTEQVIEHRVDPLTGTVASVNGALGEKARLFLGAVDLEGLRDLEERSRAGCPFCSAGEKGTRFPPEFLPEGQLRLGRSVAMPNLFSKCAFDSVVVVDRAGHVLFPSRIAPEALASAILTSAELVRRARAFDPALVHHLAGMNFLQPGGSSVAHPHLQVHARGVPYSGVSRLLGLGAEWRARTGRCHWEELVAQERALGARHLGTTGSVEWLAAWAPAHQREVWGLLPGTGSLAEIGEAQAEAFAQGISRVISFYEESGTHPFTFAFFSSPRTGQGGEFWLQVRLCSRPAFRPLYSNYDTWFAPKLVGDEAHTESPEAWAARLRQRW